MAIANTSFDSSLLVRDPQGAYRPASADEVLHAARRVLSRRVRRGCTFSSPEVVRDFLRLKLGIHPGAHILLHVEGERNVRAVFAQIDAIEAMAVDPADVYAEYWIALGNRLNGRGALPHYTAERHEAWLRRRQLRPDSIVKSNKVERP